MAAHVPRHLLLLAAICALAFFAALGRPALTDSDEGFYAESAREMVESGDWLTPYYNYQPRFEKPVLYYWMAAGAYLVAGPSPGAARLPSALAGLGLVLLTFFCARRWCGETEALLAGVITATSAAGIAMAHQALPDLPLALFVTAAVWTALVGLFDDPRGAPEPRSRLPWLVAAALAAAAAMLMKGPVGPALAAAVLLPIAVFERRRCGAWLRARPGHLLLAAAVFLAAVAPWYAAMTAEHGVAYLYRFFGAENLERFATARYNDPRPVWYYLPIVAGGLLPWTPFMLLWWPAARDAWRRRTADPTVLRLAVWAAAPLLAYTLSVGKQPRYILPLLPPLAMLLAWSMTHAATAPATRRLFTAAAAAGGGILLLIAGLLLRASPLFIEWDSAWTAAVAIALGACGALVCLTAARRWWQPVAGLAAAMIVATLGAHYVLLASPGPAPVQRMAALVADARGAGEPYCRHRVFDRNLVFYTGARYQDMVTLDVARDFLRSPERVLCVLRAEDAARLERDGLPLRRLGSVSFLNTGGLTLRALVDPDPGRELTEAVLVANR